MLFVCVTLLSCACGGLCFDLLYGGVVSVLGVCDVVIVVLDLVCRSGSAFPGVVVWFCCFVLLVL